MERLHVPLTAETSWRCTYSRELPCSCLWDDLAHDVSTDGVKKQTCAQPDAHSGGILSLLLLLLLMLSGPIREESGLDSVLEHVDSAHSLTADTL